MTLYVQKIMNQIHLSLAVSPNSRHIPSGSNLKQFCYDEIDTPPADCICLHEIG